jgi:hypothetical protein
MSLLDTASLIVTPNGYKEGKLYSVIPSDGSGDMSVVRATTATRVNSAGLVELVPYNLLQYSEQFDNAVWTIQNTTITANSATAPNGTTTADSLIASSGTDNYKGLYITESTSAPKTLSFYAKKGGKDWAMLLGYNGINNVWFNVNNGTIGTIGSNFTNAEIANIGDGWYRCSATLNSSIVLSPNIGIYASDADNSISCTGNGSASLYIWGAQLVEGSTAKDYQKTETRLNIPRLDYSNGTCPSLLLEPQRTNLALQSSSFESGFWAKINSTITANTIVSPSGIQDADTLTSTSTIDENQVRFGTFSILGNVGSSYTTSVYAKKGSANYLRLRNLFVNNGGSDGNAWFDLTNGSVGTIQSSQTASIEDAGNGWWRCSLTGVVGSLISFNFIDIGFADADNDYIPSTIINGYIWGAQIEAGSYPTSYIPTTSASVTRNADVISKTGISSLIGQTEGTLFVEFEKNIGLDAANMVFSLSDGSSSNLIYYNLVGGVIEFLSGGTTQAVKNNIILSNGTNRIAAYYKANDFGIYLNGTNIFTDTSGSVGSMNKLNIGSWFNDSFTAGTSIKAAALWQTRLDNATLAQLTTI